MNRIRVLFLLICFLCYTNIHAQMLRDVLLFSDNHPTISSRSIALGNAMGALGGDVSATFYNPAGIGIYRRFEVILGLGAYFNNTKTNFVGNPTQDGVTKMAFGALGLVIPSKTKRERNPWKFVNYALSINRVNNLTSHFSYSGLTNGSRLLAFAENANGSSISQLDPYESWVAYYGFLIDSVAPFTYQANGGVSDTTYTLKRQLFTKQGGTTDIVLSIAGNLNNRFYIGGTLGLNLLNYDENSNYVEQSDTLDFKFLSFEEQRNITGLGFTFKLGMIYRISKVFRAGLAIHTPSILSLNDSYNTALSSTIVYNTNTQNTDFPMEDQDPFVVSHTLYTPWLIHASLGAVIQKKALIGLDIEYLDFGSASFELPESDKTSANIQFMNELNEDIRNFYQSVIRIRLGAEYALNRFRFRLGYKFQSSAYTQSVEGITDLRHDLCAGLGVRWQYFFLDLAFQQTFKDFDYRPYNTVSSVAQRVIGTDQTTLLLLTIGASIY